MMPDQETAFINVIAIHKMLVGQVGSGVVDDCDHILRLPEMPQLIKIPFAPVGSEPVVFRIQLLRPGEGESVCHLEQDVVPLERAEVGIAPVADDIPAAPCHALVEIRHDLRGKISECEGEAVPDIFLLKSPVDRPVPMEDLQIPRHKIDGGEGGGDVLTAGQVPVGSADGNTVQKVGIQQFFAPDHGLDAFVAKIICNAGDVVRKDLRS